MKVIIKLQDKNGKTIKIMWERVAFAIVLVIYTLLILGLLIGSILRGFKLNPIFELLINGKDCSVFALIIMVLLYPATVYGVINVCKNIRKKK